MFLSLAVPVFNEENSISKLEAEIVSELKKINIINYEIIFVDDGSSDGTRNEIKKLVEKNPSVVGLVFERNFGKSLALNAAFKKAKGDILITLDGDLQDDPSEIKNFLHNLKEFDFVNGWKKERLDPIGKRLPSKIFNYFARKIFKVEMRDFNSGFKGYQKKVYKKIDLYGDMHRYIPVLVCELGFLAKEIPVNHRKRVFGISKFGIERILIGFLDFITIMFTSRFSLRPNHFLGTLATILIFVGSMFLIYLFSLWFFDMGPIGNRPLLFFSILSIVVGFQILSLGIIAEMILKFKITKNNYSNIEHKIIENKKNENK